MKGQSRHERSVQVFRGKPRNKEPGLERTRKEEKPRTLISPEWSGLSLRTRSGELGSWGARKHGARGQGQGMGNIGRSDTSLKWASCVAVSPKPC
jgi:hypothetical protein